MSSRSTSRAPQKRQDSGAFAGYERCAFTGRVASPASSRGGGRASAFRRNRPGPRSQRAAAALLGGDWPRQLGGAVAPFGQRHPLDVGPLRSRSGYPRTLEVTDAHERPSHFSSALPTPPTNEPAGQPPRRSRRYRSVDPFDVSRPKFSRSRPIRPFEITSSGSCTVSICSSGLRSTAMRSAS